jgi:preprotein translocase subunit YajC
MNFLISDAYAQGAAAPQGGGIQSLIFMGVLFLVFYFLLIRPQAKRAKEHKKMVEALAKGDEVVTNGGVLGKVTKVGDDFVVIEVAQGVELNVQRQSVAALMPKGTAKNI